MTPTLSTLTTDVLIVVFELLTVGDLAALSVTCKALHFLVSGRVDSYLMLHPSDFSIKVQHVGWKTYLLLNPRASPSISKILSTWDAYSQVRYHYLSDMAWADGSFIARPISRPWQGKFQPLLAISSTRLIISVGSTLYSYIFTSHVGFPCLQFESSYTWHNYSNNRKDITGLSFAPGDDINRTLYVGFGHGSLERVILPTPKQSALGKRSSLEIKDMHKTKYDLHDGDAVQCLTSSDHHLLSLSLNGMVVLTDFSNFSAPTSSTIELQSRSWSGYLSTKARTPFVAVGTASATPLAIYNIRESELSPHPSLILGKTNGTGESARSSAVYGICGTPPLAHWGSDQVLVSGWYDGLVQIHDLRSSSRGAPIPGSFSPAPLTPVMSLYDPLALDPIYSVATGGGCLNHIAAGTARHSVVAFWDIRSPRKGWSVHAPGNDSSPVYSIILESSRLFGVTQSRPFVYDFGPGVTKDTYPGFPDRAGSDRQLGYSKDTSGVGVYVTKYNHFS
jgi:hypothetical protein